MVVEEKRTRIIETAIELAEQGGFEAVRLRDVAERADVALGTLYKRFHSKEDILVAALELEAAKLERRLAARPARGATVEARTMDFFEAATRGLLRREKLARAVLRAITSGDAQLTQSVARFHMRMTQMIVSAMRGSDETDAAAGPDAHAAAFILQQIWFAALVGWMAGMVTKQQVTEQVRITLELLVRGVGREAPAAIALDPGDRRGY
jgi:AcrR family transcriptional regulator